MAFKHRVYNFAVVCSLFLLYAKEGTALTFTRQPSSATGIEGQSITVTWTADLDGGEPWTNVKVNQETPTEKPMILFSNTGLRHVFDDYTSRDADLNLTAFLNGTILTSVFTMRNLNYSTDDDEKHSYALIITFSTSFGSDNRGSAHMKLKVLVPPTITSPNPSPGSVTVNETQTAQLVCTATGHPAPNYNWTRDGVIVGTGSPFTTPAVTYDDDKACYTCVAYNDVLDAKTANVCLNVQYKPRSTLNLVSAKSTVCQNDKVNLTCTSGPANPAPSSYEFYDNGVLVGTSASIVYEATATVGLPAFNKFVCIPKNLLGAALENKSVEVTAKVAPTIVTSPQATTLVEGSALTLYCNASGAPAPNITWTKVSGSIVGNVDSETYTISSVTRGQEGTYRCAASNGDECSKATADALVTVNYPPESTNISTNQSENTFIKGNSVRLSCTSKSKPQSCNVTFYHGNTVIQSYYDKTCAGAEAASHVIESIDGCNLEDYSCKAENQYGQQEAKVNLTIKVPATLATSPSSDLELEEGNPLQLNCTATGCPTPNITWTKTGNSASLASGNDFFLSYSKNSLEKSDTGYYKCSVDNGVVGSPLNRTIYVNVTYKPSFTALTSTMSRACLNDSVTLQCTTDANPPAHEYRFYLNDQLVHTSMSGVYQLNVPETGNNTYKCEPKNAVGAGTNATVTIATKAPPKITWSTPNQTLVEKDRLVLMCNVTGSDPMNVTWSKVGGSSYPEGPSYTFTSIGRGDEASYQCTAHNGNECPVATATSTITVNYKPENTNLTASIATACVGESLTLTCETHAKPAATKYRFYENNVLIMNQSVQTYTFSLSVNGANVYTCQPENSAGNGTMANVSVNVKAAPEITYVTASQDVIQGNNLTLVCNVTDQSGQLNVSWHKVGGGQLSSVSTHTISSVDSGDTGSYVCKAHNGNECDVQTKLVNITVTIPATITSHSNSSVRSNENDQVTLFCRVSGVPTPNVTWTRNGQPVNNARGETYSFNALESLSGNYSCVVSNGIGVVQRRTFDVKTKAYCKDHECKHGGTCRSEGQSYRCLCTRGLIGRYCELEDPVHTEFSCILVIIIPAWAPEYEDKKSPKFKDLEKRICDKMFLVFNRIPLAIPGKRLVTCNLIFARKGSIHTNTLLTFNDTALKSEVVNAINGGTVNQTIFGNLTLRASALEVNPRTDPCSSEPCKFNSKCVVQGENGYRCDCDAFRYGTHCEKGIGLIPGIIIIIACILIIFILIILCVLYCKRRKSETYPSGGAENGTEMKNYYLPDHAGAAANANVTTTDEKPPMRNGQPTEVYRPQNENEELVYADLSFKTSDDTKKETFEKLPEKSETLYADIVSFQQSSDEQRKDSTLEEEGIEMKEKETKTEGGDDPEGEKKESPEKPLSSNSPLDNPIMEPDKEIKNEVGDENDCSNQTDNNGTEVGGNEAPENPQINQDNTSPSVRLV